MNPTRTILIGALLAGPVVLWACGAGNVESGGAEGVTETPDGAKCSEEICDGKDNDCDGQIDEGFDLDGDGFRTCEGDCNDNDPNVNPNATEVKNGIDDDCDGKVDINIVGEDQDGDGYPYPADCNDSEPLVGPGAIEVAGDGVDNNCDGKVDEAAPDCAAGATTAAASIGVCTEWLVPNSVAAGTANADGSIPMNTQTVTLPDGRVFLPQKGTYAVGMPASQKIVGSFGQSWKPQKGSKMLLLSTGVARDNVGTGDVYLPQQGTQMTNYKTRHPLGGVARCKNGFGFSRNDPDVHDSSELRLQLKAPQNAKSLRFNFAFFSAEFPEYVGSQFNDRFVASIDSKQFKGNVSFDKLGREVSINSAFFEVCTGPGCSKPVSELNGTGYELLDQSRIPMGGGTGWLSTVTPVTPGETLNLRLVVFDECDQIYDSAVLIDGFEWDVQAVEGPTTDFLR